MSIELNHSIIRAADRMKSVHTDFPHRIDLLAGQECRRVRSVAEVFFFKIRIIGQGSLRATCRRPFAPRVAAYTTARDRKVPIGLSQGPKLLAGVLLGLVVQCHESWGDRATGIPDNTLKSNSFTSK